MPNVECSISKKQLDSYIEVQNELIYKIKLNDPLFFTDFKKLLESGLPTKVESAINIGADNLTQAIGFSKSELHEMAQSDFIEKLRHENLTGDFDSQKSKIKLLLSQQLNNTTAENSEPAYAYEWYYVNWYIGGTYIAVAAAAVLVVVIFAVQESSELDSSIVSADTLGVSVTENKLKSLKSYFGSDSFTKEEFVSMLTSKLAN